MFLGCYGLCNYVTKERIMRLIYIAAAGAAAATVVSSAPVAAAVVGGTLLGAAALAVKNSTAIMESGTGASTSMPLPVSEEEQRSTEPYSPREHRLLRVIRNAGKQDLTGMENPEELQIYTLTEKKGCLEKAVDMRGKCKYISHCDVPIRVNHKDKSKDIKPHTSVPCFKKIQNGGIYYPSLMKLEAGVKPSTPREELNLKKINFGVDAAAGEDPLPQVSAQNTGDKRLTFQFSETCGGESVSLEPGETREIPDVEEMCASLSEVENVRRH